MKQENMILTGFILSWCQCSSAFPSNGIYQLHQKRGSLEMKMCTKGQTRLGRLTFTQQEIIFQQILQAGSLQDYDVTE